MQLTATTARHLLKHRQRVRASIGGNKPIWVQIIAQDGASFHALISTNTDTSVRNLDAGDLMMFEVDPNDKPVAVDPLLFAAGLRIDASKHGHNGVAEAMVLLALMELPALFSYTKPKGSAERRTVKLRWVNGERCGGDDYDRDMAGRAFRFDRVAWVELAPNAIACPVWTGEAYERGLP